MAINFKKKKDNQAESFDDKDIITQEEYIEEEEGFNLLNGIKHADSKVEEFAFGGVEKKLKIVAKVVLYIFMALGLFGVILTMLLTSSLGGLGVIVALLIVATFVFLGYGISSVIYGFADVVEKSKQPQIDLSKIQIQPQEVVKEVAAPVIKDEEFPEF